MNRTINVIAYPITRLNWNYHANARMVFDRRSKFEWPNVVDAEGKTTALSLRYDVVGRIIYATNILSKLIEIDPEKRGGIPVLMGSRFPISRLFAEVASGRSIVDIAEDKDLDIVEVRQIFEAFASYLGRPFAS